MVSLLKQYLLTSNTSNTIFTLEVHVLVIWYLPFILEVHVLSTLSNGLLIKIFKRLFNVSYKSTYYSNVIFKI